MAKVSAKTAAKRLRAVSSATFIQRSRSVPSEEKAITHNLTGNPQREFFGLAPDDELKVKDSIEKLLQARLNAAG